jgi:hypothetical protein
MTYIITVDPVSVPSTGRQYVHLQHAIVTRHILERDVRVPRNVGPARDVFESAVDAPSFALPVGRDELGGGLGEELRGVLGHRMAGTSALAL